jgi:hypothetical protein
MSFVTSRGVEREENATAGVGCEGKGGYEEEKRYLPKRKEGERVLDM